MEKKITKKEMFTMIANAIDTYISECGEENGFNADMVAFIDREIELLNKKSDSKKPTKTQIENESIKEVILEVLAEMGAVSATMIATDPRVGVSNQKVTALLRQLKDEGKVVRSEDKGKALFSVAEVVED